ncbi:MAG: hypothetical protein RLZZ161_802, partial [Bacteroidota bacterium]
NGTLTSDYGFKVSDWQQADTKAWGKHVSYGVKPFISERTTSALQQMIYPAGTGLIPKNRLSIYPNPASDIVYSPVLAGKTVHIYQTNGTLIKSCNSASGEISVADLSDGTYIMELQDAVKTLLLIRH